MKSLPLKVAIACLVPLALNAAENRQEKSFTPNVDIKCFVELLGGSHAIHRNYDVPIADKKHYKRTLIEREISARKKNNIRVIYKVKECREMHQNFKNEEAQALEKAEEEMG